MQFLYTAGSKSIFSLALSYVIHKIKTLSFERYVIKLQRGIYNLIQDRSYDEFCRIKGFYLKIFTFSLH